MGHFAGSLATSPVRRHWWLLAGGILVGAAGGSGAAWLTPTQYDGVATVLVNPVPTQSPGGQLTSAAINLDTEAELARSSPTTLIAARDLGQSPDQVVRAVSVEILANTSVLVVHFEAATPETAQAGAQAFARAYLTTRADLANRALIAQATAVADKLAESNRELAALDAKIADLPPTSAQLATLRANRQILTTQIGVLSARATDLATTTVDGGRIIRDAALPTAPSRPAVAVLLAEGAAAGLLIGLGAAVARHRFARRVRGAGDVTRHPALPLLAEFSGSLPGLRTLAPRVFAPQQPPGRAFHRLRNEVVAALAGEDRVVLVTGASPGKASTVVAANLAAALARADNEVVLVGANVPELGADRLLLSHVFDIADVPGLTDVLTRRATLSAALQRAPRAPRLQVITPGGTASAAGLLQSEAVRTTITALREQARYIVVEAPSAASGADAQSLAGLADAAIVVVETGRSRHSDLADAARQLELIGTRILGAVVLPPLAPEPDEEEPSGLHRAEDAILRATDTWINPTTMNAPTAVHPVVDLAPPLEPSTSTSAPPPAPRSNGRPRSSGSGGG